MPGAGGPGASRAAGWAGDGVLCDQALLALLHQGSYEPAARYYTQQSSVGINDGELSDAELKQTAGCAKRGRFRTDRRHIVQEQPLQATVRAGQGGGGWGLRALECVQQAGPLIGSQAFQGGGEIEGAHEPASAIHHE